MFRLSKVLEKLEDKSEARFKSWFARNKAKLPMRVPAVIVGWYFYGMFLNSLRLGIASTFHQTDEEIQIIWVLNPFKNWGAVFTGFGIVTTLVIVLIICLITKKGYRMIATESIEEINRRLAALPPEHPAKYPHGLFLKAKENLWGNIVIGLGNRLAVFQSRLADKITRNHDVDLLLPGKRPCVYFVIISAQDSAYRFLSSLFFSLALPQLSNFARLQCPDGRLPVLTNFCLDEYCNIGYLDGVADSLNSIRGFNMSAQIVVQSLSQWQEKYPGKEWENQLATFDQTLYMGCNDLTSAKYISEKCGKVTISVLNNQMPMMPLFSPVYSSTRPYSQTRSNTQRDLMNPDEVLRLENKKCLALFKGHKPALLYKMTPEELPDYAGLTTCRVIDYIPEWRRKEAKTAPQKKASVQKEPSNIPKPPNKEKQPDRSGQPPAYDLAEDDEIGMVECTVDSIRGL